MCLDAAEESRLLQKCQQGLTSVIRGSLVTFTPNLRHKHPDSTLSEALDKEPLLKGTTSTPS